MTQIVKRAIQNNAVDGEKLRLLNGQSVRALAADGSNLSLFRVDASDKFILDIKPEFSGSAMATLSDVSGSIGTSEQTINDRIDQEVQTLQGADSSLSNRIDALASGLAWRERVAVISEDADLAAAVEGTLLSSIMPFSDDDPTTLDPSQILDGDLLLSKNGASSKLMKVTLDGSLNKIITFVDVPALANGHTFIVEHDLIDAPGSQENRAIYSFTGSDLLKLADIDFSLASGIDVSGSYSQIADQLVAAGDSVEVALGKLEGQIQGLISKLDAMVIHVSKDGNDSTGNGSEDKPFLTIAAANAAITDAYYNSTSDFKRYIVSIGPGAYVESAGFELKSHVTYVGMGSRSSTSLQVASGDIVFNAGSEAQPKINLLNLAIFSPITVNSSTIYQNDGVNPVINQVAIVEAYHVFMTGALTINQTSSGQTQLQMRYSRLGNIVTNGRVSQFNDFCTMGSITHGSATPSADQGFAILVGCSTTAPVTMHAASLYLRGSMVGNIDMQDHALGPQALEMGVESARGSISLSADVHKTLTSDIGNLKYVPENGAHFNRAIESGADALNDLSARLTLLGAHDVDFTPGDATLTIWRSTAIDNVGWAIDHLAGEINTSHSRIDDLNAHQVSHTPYDATKWSGWTITNAGEALDSLAWRTTDVESKTQNLGMDGKMGAEHSIFAGPSSDISRFWSGSVTDDGQGSIVGEINGLMHQAIYRVADVEMYKLDASEKGAANGVATLDGNGLVPSHQLPSYVDDVLEYADFVSLPVSGEQGKIYVTLDNGKLYRWSGSQYIYITSGAVDSVNGKTGVVTLNSDEIAEGVSNLYYTEARFDSRFDSRLALKSTSDLAEGINLYYTQARFDSALSMKNTDNLSEGMTNLYFSDARAKAAAVSNSIMSGILDVAPSQDAVFQALSAKADDSAVVKSVNGVSPVSGNVSVSTDNISEGASNLYFSAARAKTAAVVNSLAGSETDMAPSVAAVKSFIQSSSSDVTMETIVLTSTDVTNGYITLSMQASLVMDVIPKGFVSQFEGDDFTVSVDVNSLTRITFAVGGTMSSLVAGDKVKVIFSK